MLDLTFFKAKFNVYPKSIHSAGDLTCFMIDAGEMDQLCVVGHDPSFPGEPYGQSGYLYTLSDLDHAAAVFLRKHFSFCAPASVLDRKVTFGVGDRLGLAGPGHLRVFQEYDAFPVLAQQSVRELMLTHRTMDDVIDSSTFAVFRAGYLRGFGVDGDHLKTLEEVRKAVACGCTMITLDCSNYIDNESALLPEAEMKVKYPDDSKLAGRYLGRAFEIGPDTTLTYDLEELRRIAAVYSNAVEFINRVYLDCIASCGREVDLELSLDETLTVTSPLAHYFVSNELKIRGIRFVTVAPRFSGEFQKGIDYIGNLEALRQEIRIHSSIAKFFGYKLSLHSGSDKFSMFPILNEETGGRFHIKTAGTNWLEAARVIANVDPALFRKMYDIAAATFEENRKLYHVTPDLGTIPDIDSLKDGELSKLLDLTASRQVMHIGYGKILENEDVKKQLFHTLRERRQTYSDALYTHIGRHARTLGIPQIQGTAKIR